MSTETPSEQDRVVIFDTTLRDGEQSPGASMTKEEKTRIARQLERLRVDVIEAGFPASSNGDFEAVQDIARAVHDSTVCGLARANENDIRRAGEDIQTGARILAAGTRIVEAVWEHDYDTFSNVVEVYIRYLRKKVDEPFSTPLIHTVRGVGYELRPGK